MALEHVERKLAAILAADIAGYSRLTGADEEGTMRRLRVLRAELIDPAIQTNRGRIFKTMGDGILVEFASVVDAMRSFLEVQRGVAVRNADFAPENRIEFRVGIHVGDVMVQPDGTYSVTALISRPGLKASPSQAVYVFPRTPTTKCVTA